MKRSHWIAALLFLASLLVSLGCFIADAGRRGGWEGQLNTDDTAVRIEGSDRGPVLTSLRCGTDPREWIGASNPSTIALIDKAEVDGKTLALNWRFAGKANGSDGRSVTLTFVCENPALEAQSLWQALEGPGPIKHRIVIRNTGTSPVALGRQPTLTLKAHSPSGGLLENWWIEKGAGKPSDIGIHREKVSSGFATTILSKPYGGAIPWTAVHDEGGGVGWYAGIEFSGRVAIDLRGVDAATIAAEMGLAAEAKGAEVYRTVLAPGETLETPTVFIGCFSGDIDDAGNRLRRWISLHLRPATSDARYPLLTNNSWGSGMAVDEKLARRMIDDSAAVGMEMFGVDAGWFRWVGDWRANPDKFFAGLGPIADYAHSKGLKIGLWVGWTQGGDRVDETGNHQILSVNDATMKDWFAADYSASWKPSDFTGADVCLGDRRAQDWCLKTLRSVISENKLDMLEHDQRMIVDKCVRSDHGHSSSRSDVASRACDGYYAIYDTLRRENPNLLFEDCVNGGNMVDFGVVRRVHYISITDSYDPLSNRRAFCDASYVLPPAMCECYVANHPGKTLANFKYMLRSGMMGWCTIMLDMSQWNEEQRGAARHEFEIYRKRLRPLIVNANLYHVSPRPDGVQFDGIQYIDPSSGKGVLYAFRGAGPTQRRTFVLKGLERDARYELSFEDGRVAPLIRSGQDLMASGIEITLSEPESSQLVYLSRQPTR